MFPVVLYLYIPPLFFKDHNGNLCYPCHRILWRTFLPQFSILMNLYLYTLLNISFICDGEIYLLTEDNNSLINQLAVVSFCVLVIVGEHIIQC